MAGTGLGGARSGAGGARDFEAEARGPLDVGACRVSKPMRPLFSAGKQRREPGRFQRLGVVSSTRGDARLRHLREPGVRRARRRRWRMLARRARPSATVQSAVTERQGPAADAGKRPAHSHTLLTGPSRRSFNRVFVQHIWMRSAARATCAGQVRIDVASRDQSEVGAGRSQRVGAHHPAVRMVEAELVRSGEMAVERARERFGLRALEARDGDQHRRSRHHAQVPGSARSRNLRGRGERPGGAAARRRRHPRAGTRSLAGALGCCARRASSSSSAGTAWPRARRAGPGRSAHGTAARPRGCAWRRVLREDPVLVEVEAQPPRPSDQLRHFVFRARGAR